MKQIPRTFAAMLVGAALGLAALPQAHAQAGRQQLGMDILGNSKITLLNFHSSGISSPNSTALANIQSTSECEAAHTSHYSDVGDTTVWLHTGMLSAIKSLANTYGYTFRITELAGGDHSSGSYHYRGTAFDVDVINGSGVSSSNPNCAAFMSRCRSLGAIEVLGPGDAGHSTHIHAAWASGTSASAPGGCVPVAITSPTITTRTDGKVFAFGINSADGSISYRMKTGVAGSWGNWVSLGGSGFTFIRSLSISNGGVAVFGMGSGNIYYRYLASSGAGVWSNYVNIGGSGFSCIAPVMKSNGRMALVGCGIGTSIFYAEQTAAGPGAAWTGFTDLAASSMSEVDAVALPTGEVGVFGVGSGSPAWYKYKAASGTWSGWSNLGGSGFSRLSAVLETNGKMAFFGCGSGSGSGVYYQEQSAAGPTASWSGWLSVGGSGFSCIKGVALPGSGLAVFGCTDYGAGSSIFYWKRAAATGSFVGATDLAATSMRRLSATADSAGLMTVVGRGATGGSLWERRQTDASHWASWVNLGGALK